jgi:hypothetical protein
MTPKSSFEQVVFLLVIAGEAAVLINLWRRRLSPSYPFFSLFMLFQFVRSVVLVGLNPNRNLYGWIWIPSEVISWILCYLVVFELYSKVLADYPGIRRVSQMVLAAGLALCLAVAAATLAIDMAGGAERFPILRAVNVVRRGAASTLLLFLLLMLGYLAWYPAPLRRNLIVHAILNALYCLTISLTVFIRNIAGPALTRPLSCVIGACTVAILAAWAVLLSQAGEQRISVAALAWNRKDQARLLEQLEAINRTLAR